MSAFRFNTTLSLLCNQQYFHINRNIEIVKPADNRLTLMQQILLNWIYDQVAKLDAWELEFTISVLGKSYPSPVPNAKGEIKDSINFRRRSTSYLVQALANAPGIVH